MNVFLSPEAEEQLDRLLLYLENVWGERAMFNFVEKMEQALAVVREIPLAYPMSESMPGVRRCVITRQTSLYYRILDEEIEIAAVLDNRQDLPS